MDFKKLSHIIETREFRETKRNLGRQVKQRRADEAADKARILKNDLQIQKLLQGRKYKLIWIKSNTFFRSVRFQSFPI